MAFWQRMNEATAQLSQNGESNDFVLLKCESLQLLGDGPGSNEDVVNTGASG
jgi:hypothetical protein